MRRAKEIAFWGSAAAAFVGAFVGAVLQLASITLPIYIGDYSDFSINIEPPGIAIDRAIERGPLIKTVNVSILDFYPHINSYKHDVFFSPMNHSKCIDIAFDPPSVRAGEKSTMSVHIDQECFGTHYIQIQGIGGNGKKRNSTFVVRIYRHVSFK
jgi:hypothetical protein